VPRDLTKVVRLVGMAQQPGEHAPAGASEKDGSRIASGLAPRCSHHGYKCTHIGDDPQAAASRYIS
jgi:hypothetical protein